jgi:hypothetical protein
METAAALSAIFQVYQSKSYHNEELSKAEKYFAQEMLLTKLAAARERERDEHSMISQRIQTLIVMQSLFFGAACGFVIEGDLHSDTNPFIVFCYSCFLALSQVLLLISLVTSLKIQMVMSNFKINDTRNILKIKGQVNSYYLLYCKNYEKKSIDWFLWGSVFLMFDSGIIWYTRLVVMENNTLYMASYVYALILGGGICFYIFKLLTIKNGIQHIQGGGSRVIRHVHSIDNNSSDEDDEATTVNNIS